MGSTLEQVSTLAVTGGRELPLNLSLSQGCISLPPSTPANINLTRRTIFIEEKAQKIQPALAVYLGNASSQTLGGHIF